MIDSSEHWKGNFVIDPATVYNGDIDPVEDAPKELRPQNRDTPMTDSPPESNTLSSSDVTLVANDPSLGQIKAPDQLRDCSPEHATPDHFFAIYNDQVQDF